MTKHDARARALEAFEDIVRGHGVDSSYFDEKEIVRAFLTPNTDAEVMEAVGWLKLRRQIYEEGNIHHLVKYIDILIQAALQSRQGVVEVGALAFRDELLAHRRKMGYVTPEDFILYQYPNGLRILPSPSTIIQEGEKS